MGSPRTEAVSLARISPFRLRWFKLNHYPTIASLIQLTCCSAGKRNSDRPA